ncbi:hypothetical protein LguiB_024050 [Lonicera macranthoides]
MKVASRVTSIVGDGMMKRPDYMEKDIEALLQFKKSVVDDYGIPFLGVVTKTRKSIPNGEVLQLVNLSSSLVDIDIFSNPLGHYIPDAFGNMKSLENLNLNNCDLEYVDCIKELIRDFGVKCKVVNKFNGFVPDFTRFSSLRKLWLGSNNLQRPFPKNFGQSFLLDTLNLSWNELNGSFPNLTLFSSLTKLDLSYDKLKGKIPESIKQLSNLKELLLSLNLLTLEFSSDWTPLFQLDVIALVNWELPSSLKNCTSSEVIDVSENKLFGESVVFKEVCVIMEKSYRMEKFDGIMDFSLWQMSMKDYLVVLDLDDVLEGLVFMYTDFDQSYSGEEYLAGMLV